MLKKRIIVRFFALIFSAVLLSQECFLQVPTQWEVKENQTVSFDSRCSLSNGSQKTSSFEVSYGSRQVRGYNEEEKNPYSLAGFLKHTAKGALEGAAENAVFYGVEKAFGAAKNILSCFVAGTLIKTSDIRKNLIEMARKAIGKLFFQKPNQWKKAVSMKKYISIKL